VLLFSSLPCASHADAEPPPQTDEFLFAVKGHVKAFLITGRVPFEDRDFFETRDRLAVETDLELFRRLRLKLEYRGEAIGSLMGPSDFSSVKQESERDFLDLDWTAVDRRDLLVRHRLHRAVLSLDIQPFRMALGRQRIAWGTGKLWSPTDLFNPLNPLSLERGERRGADAVLASVALSPAAEVAAVYAPIADGTGRKAARLHATIQGRDVSLLAGARSGEWFLGGDFASPLGNALIRGEMLAAFKDNGNAAFQGVIAGEYTFPSSFGIVVEYFENGEGKSRWRDFELERLLRGEIVSLGKRFLGAIVGYDLTPLWRAETAVAQSLADGSTYINPRLAYAATANTEVAVSAGVTRGHAKSEFGRLPHLYYAELRWAF
jgi:hypothetical protein